MGRRGHAHLIILADPLENEPPTASTRDLAHTVESARLAGWTVHVLATPDPELALSAIRWRGKQRPTVWLGLIPAPERYRALHAAALRQGLRLLNDPDEHERAMELDQAYPRLAGLTPRTAAAHSVDEAVAAAETVGYPLFVKGSVQSRKSKGWKACVAEDRAELEPLVATLLRSGALSRGKVVLRELVPLRHVRKTGLGFPQGREFRYFLYQGRILAGSYYWDPDDPLAQLSPAERTEVESLAVAAARAVDVPFCSVDVGQREDEEWTVIETGDAQFCGLCQVPRVAYWKRLAEVLRG